MKILSCSFRIRLCNLGPPLSWTRYIHFLCPCLKPSSFGCDIRDEAWRAPTDLSFPPKRVPVFKKDKWPCCTTASLGHARPSLLRRELLTQHLPQSWNIIPCCKGCPQIVFSPPGCSSKIHTRQLRGCCRFAPLPRNFTMKRVPITWVFFLSFFLSFNESSFSKRPWAQNVLLQIRGIML